MEIKTDCMKVGGFDIHVLTPENMKQINEAEDEQKPYQLTIKPNKNGFYFIQIKSDTFLTKNKINKNFPAKTIFALQKKDSETAHHFLARFLLGLEEDQMLSAGEFTIENDSLSSWNLHSGTYWKKLHLDRVDIIKDVGLPMKKFHSNFQAVSKKQSHESSRLLSSKKYSISMNLQTHGLMHEKQTSPKNGPPPNINISFSRCTLL